MFKPLQLIDLPVLSAEELAVHRQADLGEILLKQGVIREFLRWIESNRELVVNLLNGVYGRERMLYILRVDEKNALQKLIDALITAIPEQKSMIMTTAEQLHQRGYIKGYLAGYATSYASSAALAIADNEFRDYFLEKKKPTPLTTLLEQSLQKGIRAALLSLLQDKNIEAGTIAEAIGWSKEDVEKMQEEVSPSSP